MLREVLAKHDFIDILKIDIEGAELEVLQAIDPDILKRINTLYFEIDENVELKEDFQFHPELFISRKRGESYQLRSRSHRTV